MSNVRRIVLFLAAAASVGAPAAFGGLSDSVSLSSTGSLDAKGYEWVNADRGPSGDLSERAIVEARCYNEHRVRSGSRRRPFDFQSQARSTTRRHFVRGREVLTRSSQTLLWLAKDGVLVRNTLTNSIPGSQQISFSAYSFTASLTIKSSPAAALGLGGKAKEILDDVLAVLSFEIKTTASVTMKLEGTFDAFATNVPPTGASAGRGDLYVPAGDHCKARLSGVVRAVGTLGLSTSMTLLDRLKIGLSLNLEFQRESLETDYTVASLDEWGYVRKVAKAKRISAKFRVQIDIPFDGKSWLDVVNAKGWFNYTMPGDERDLLRKDRTRKPA